VRGFFVAGTDTGVGKTEVARAVCWLLRERGWSPLALKPVETGCAPDAPADALALREACGSGQALDDLCPYRFRLPAAPLVAAEAEGRSIDLRRIEEIVARASAPIVVEAAGGLLVPLARGASSLVTNLDLAKRLGLPVLLVARAGLGTLNHCALSVQALERRGLSIVAVVLNRVSPQDDPSVATNAHWVGELTGARVIGPLPFAIDPLERPRALSPFVDSVVPRR
jgi:dethiobiotin synthetase